jgi:hypothetical protein
MPDVFPAAPQETHLMCVIISAMALGPRIIGVLWWLLAGDRWNAAFNGAILPILGILVVPWTTLVYVLVAEGGLTGLDLVALGIALVVDVFTWGAGGYSNKDKVGWNT